VNFHVYLVKKRVNGHLKFCIGYNDVTEHPGHVTLQPEISNVKAPIS